MKIIFLTIEFSVSTFSGNGVYATAQVRALRSLGHDVLVICGCPAGAPPLPPPPPGVPGLLALPLPVWGRLDLGSGWREFALGCGAFAVARAAGAFAAEAIIGVDWHGAAAAEALEGALAAQGFPSPPYFCSNYRVYLRSAPEAEREAMRRLEGASLRRAAAATVLSRSDLDFVRHHYADEIGGSPVTVLLPALRADVAAVPPPPGPRPRRYLTCCVRASPEKEPRRFVDLVCELQRRGAFDSGEVVPLVAGAGWDAGRRRQGQEEDSGADSADAFEPGALGSVERYAWELRRRLEAEVPAAVVVDGFLDAAGMAALFADAALNVHPPAYDAYGMTIVEAASAGAPSLVAPDGHVGATDLLVPGMGQVFVADVEAGAAALADAVQALLADRERLETAGAAAAAAARAWSEKANAAALADLLRVGLERNKEKEAGMGHAAAASARGGVNVVPADTLTAAAFESTYLAAHRPVILTGATFGWPAAQEWVNSDGGVDLAALEDRFGDAEVAAVDAAPRRRGAGPRREWTLSEYAAWWRAHKGAAEKGAPDPEAPLWYLKDWHCVAACAAADDGFRPYRCPEFFRDDWLNEYYDGLTEIDSESGAGGTSGGTCSDYRFVYLGPAGTATPLHADVVRSHSWSANLAGRKRWRLLPPAAAPLIHDAAGAHPLSLHADQEPGGAADRFPHLPRAREAVLEVVQYPGEAIFVPNGWFHTVENLDDCLSINHNWVSTGGVAAAAAHLGRERARAAALIDDCVPLCGAAEFEALVQRNVGANAGMDFAGLGAMARRAAGGAAALLLRQAQSGEEESSDVGVGDDELRDLPDPPEWLTEEGAAARLRAAAPVVQDLTETLRAAMAAPGGRGAGGEEDRAARETWSAEIAANERCLSLIARALGSG